MASIVDYLSKAGKDSSYAARKKLAEQYNIKNYVGSANQNTQLLGYIQSGGKTASTKPTSVPQAVTGTLQEITPQNVQPSYKSAPVNYDEIAQKYMQNVGNAPSYNSSYQQQIDGLLNSILNREKFDYNMNADPLYQQYKDQYTMNGNLAMRDAMGQQAALTGGYGSSYASAAGQQANDVYMSQLNDKSMDLYQLALGKYNNETEGLMNQYNAALSAEDMSYQKYLQDYGQWDNNRSFAYNQALAALGQANQNQSSNFNAYQAALEQWNADKSYDYAVGRDKVSDSQWKQEFDFTKQQAAIKNAAAKSTSGGSSSKSSGGKTKDDEDKKLKQTQYGLTEVTGILDEAYKNGGMSKALEELEKLKSGGFVASDAVGQFTAYVASLEKQKKMSEKASTKTDKSGAVNVLTKNLK